MLPGPSDDVAESIAVVLVGHGSRREAANIEFAELVGVVARSCTEFELFGAYLELASPLLDEVLADVVRVYSRILVVPTLLFAAGHLKHDVPAAIDAARALGRPDQTIEVTGAVGQSTALMELATELMVESSSLTASSEVVLVVRGSSDVEATAAATDVARRIEARVGRPVHAAFLTAAEPTLGHLLGTLGQRNVPHAVVLPYLMFGGALVDTIAQQCRDLGRDHADTKLHVAPHLGAHERFGEAIVRHVRAEIGERGWLSFDATR